MGVDVEIRGSGFTALTCAAMAHHVGLPSRPSIPAQKATGASRILVLNSVSLALLRDVFTGLDPAVLGHPIEGRIVSWGGERPRRVVEAQRVVTAAELARAVAEHVRSGQPVADGVADEPPRWSIITEATAVERPRIGTREMLIREAEVVGAPLNDFLVESVEGGWLFLAPLSDGLASLQAVVPSAANANRDGLDRLMRHSELVAPRCHVRPGSSTTTPCAPSITSDMTGVDVTGGDWLRTGSGFATLDPISGEGTAFALRSAVLVFAALAGIRSGALGVDETIDHLSGRIRRSFRAHLQGCVAMYGSAFATNPEWRYELESLRAAVREHHEPDRPDSLQLRGFGLERTSG